MRPKAVMIFAAGFGSRLGELVRDKPKPMVEVGGRPMIDFALDIVEEAEVQRCVINLHYRAEVLETYLCNRERIELLRETPDILDTGGGLKHALPALHTSPVFTLNPDAVWRGPNPLLYLAGAWQDEGMDALLLLVPLKRAIAHKGTGDFRLGTDGRLQRDKMGGGHVYTGAQIIRTEVLDGFGPGPFSLNPVWDRIRESGRLFGTLYQGQWADTGTPDGLRSASALVSRP